MRAWWTVLLWLVGGALAATLARDAAASSGAVPASPPVVLDATPRVLPLAGLSRYWIDPKGDQTIDGLEVAGDTIPWKLTRTGQQERLDGGQALWIQFDVAARHGRWYLEIPNAGLDRAQLFYRDASGAWAMQQTGDHLPFHAWPVPGRVPTFALDDDPNRTIRYWVRIEHDRVDFSAPLLIYDQATLIAEREREQFLLGAYFGLAAMIALAALGSGVVYRDKCFLSYAVYVFFLGSGQLARLGITGQHLWPDALLWNQMAATVLPGLSTAAALWFMKVVAEPARFSRALDLAVWALIAAMLGAVGVDAVVDTRDSLKLLLALAAVSIAAVAGLIMLAWAAGDKGIRLVALAFLPLLVLALFPIARSMNLIPNSLLTRYGVFIGAMLEMPILYYALSVRSNRRREGELRAAALSHTDALTGLAHRAGMLQRLQTVLARARSQKQSCALLAVRIANIDAILQEFGAATVEKALVVAASHLRRAATDIDLAARMGPNEFALLIESPTSATLAGSRAQQLVADGLRLAPALPGGVTLKFHVAVAMLPHAELDAEESLRWVLDAVNDMPLDTRKLIRTLNF
ncbi:sensor domain-containing diguanylate cyclase [Caenimonas sedimenti]|nr:7TM diverse intracellular signaling domain-containing protein [Caenimonas sedimenti]